MLARGFAVVPTTQSYFPPNSPVPPIYVSAHSFLARWFEVERTQTGPVSADAMAVLATESDTHKSSVVQLTNLDKDAECRTRHASEQQLMESLMADDDDAHHLISFSQDTFVNHLGMPMGLFESSPFSWGSNPFWTTIGPRCATCCVCF
jgi:hypothetical protein